MEDKIAHIKNWLNDGSINIFGRPFAGKDTQGQVLAEILGAELIAGGDILRSQKDFAELQEIMKSGRLIPSDMYLGIVLPYFSQAKYKGKSLLLSSVGRLKGEETVIVEAAQESGHPIKAVIHLHLHEEHVWNRLAAAKQQEDRSGRSDDRDATLNTRLEHFNEGTQPVIDYFEQLGLLIEVDGSQPREHVTTNIIDALYTFSNRKTD